MKINRASVQMVEKITLVAQEVPMLLPIPYRDIVFRRKGSEGLSTGWRHPASNKLLSATSLTEVWKIGMDEVESWMYVSDLKGLFDSKTL